MAGETIFDISSFRGLDQSMSDVGGDIRTSPDMANFVIEDGRMKRAPGATQWGPILPASGDETTIMEAAYHREDGTTEYRLIAGAGGKLFRLDGSSWVTVGSGFKSNKWDAINYRKNTEEWHIITNGVDPVLYCAREGSSYAELKGVPAKGAYIALSDERLWLGGVADDQEVVYWSWDNDPNNWAVDAEHPDQGGGFIYVRTHDGTKVTAVKALMNDVVIFKDRSLHRITGSYPGEYELINVYGSTGPISENTIVSAGANVYFLCAEGLCVYNGVTVQTLALAAGDRRLAVLADRINREAAGKACSVIHRDVMYIALPIDGATDNNAVLIYDMSQQIYTLLTGYRVDSWLVHHIAGGEKLLFARAGQVMVMEGDTNGGVPIDARWVTPWYYGDSKSARKTTGRIYMSLEAKEGTQLKLTMENEKKKREKIIRLKREGLNVIRPRVKLRGRILRFGIETVDGAAVEIHQGIQIRAEADED